MFAGPLDVGCLWHRGSLPGGGTLAKQLRNAAGQGTFLAMEKTRSGFCIYIDAVVDGPIPAVRDERGLPCWHATRIEAEREIADNMITRLQEFIDGERDFEDAMTIAEYVVEVDVLSDGSVMDADGNLFGAR